ncbi:MAG: vitamin K epoxide reductase family protein [Candidatus Pacearchaeota archaeon]
MTDLWIILLSVIGLVITGYIAITHLRHKKVSCPINSRSCNEVLDSEWSTILGIKNEFLGLVYYLAIIVGVVLVNQGHFAIIGIIKVAATISTLYSVFLMMVQVRIIKGFCFYCFCTAIINIAIFILLIR